LTTFRSVAIISLLVFVLIGIGTVGFHVIEGWPWFDSFYGTLMTVSTIGADPVNKLSHSGRVFNVGLIVLGVGVGLRDWLLHAGDDTLGTRIVGWSPPNGEGNIEAA
jgi:hypothetical protein